LKNSLLVATHLSGLDLNDERVERFGAEKVGELYWKDLIYADACTGCKKCQDRCPAFATGKPLSLMVVVREFGAAAYTNPDTNLIERIGRDALWSSTTCRACQEVCMAEIMAERLVASFLLRQQREVL
jgi:Fe-S oxidoreductase